MVAPYGGAIASGIISIESKSRGNEMTDTNIRDSGMRLRRISRSNIWGFHYSTEVSSMGRMKDNPITLSDCKALYTSRKEATKAAEGKGYIIEEMSSVESKVLFNITSF